MPVYHRITKATGDGEEKRGKTTYYSYPEKAVFLLGTYFKEWWEIHMHASLFKLLKSDSSKLINPTAYCTSCETVPHNLQLKWVKQKFTFYLHPLKSKINSTPLAFLFQRIGSISTQYHVTLPAANTHTHSLYHNLWMICILTHCSWPTTFRLPNCS